MLFSEQRRIKIGLMGGSFNPAHEGHLHLACAALQRLGVDEVWWLVSQQNPLKSKTEMRPYDARVQSAKKLSKRHPQIKVKEIEKNIRTTYTADLIGFLKKRAPRAQFVWITGADNFIQMSRWHKWEEIVRNVPLAVFDRPRYSLKALGSAVASRYRRYRLSPEAARHQIFKRKPPVWVFFPMRRSALSSTEIRRRSSVKRVKKT
ncbi:MAG: nicotinate (nicotinamide) nucleotide adenylyltransferase [Alphaproteobacteria bacterium]